MNASPGPRTSGVERFELGLSSLMRLLTERHTQGDIARRSGHDLPPASWALLEHLDARGSMRVSDVAACHGVDVSTVTPRIKALRNAGLVTREAAPSDGRVSIIAISPEGSRALESVHAARTEMLDEVLDGVSPDELAVASGVLAGIADRLRAQEEHR